MLRFVCLCSDRKIQAGGERHWQWQKEVWVCLRAPRDPAAWTRPCLLCTRRSLGKNHECMYGTGNGSRLGMCLGSVSVPWFGSFTEPNWPPRGSVGNTEPNTDRYRSCPAAKKMSFPDLPQKKMSSRRNLTEASEWAGLQNADLGSE